MTKRWTRKPDLFEAPPPSVEMPVLQRAMALRLIEALLTEALIRPVVSNAEAIAMEVDHDEDPA